jgi:hypothetical protein
MEAFIAFAQKNLLPLLPLVFVLVMLSQALLRLLSALFIRPKIKVYPSGQIEIGLSQFGPTIALFGTLQAQMGDSFITKIELIVKDTTGQIFRTLEWRAFKPYTFSLVPNEELKLELVSAFLLSTKAPFKYNIVFVDDELLKSYVGEVLKIQQLWKDDEKKDVEAFLQTDAIQTIQIKFQDDLYWQAGHYNLNMVIHTSNKTYTTQFEFNLTEAQVEVLKSNIIQIVKFICDEKVQFPYINCEYSDN